jgi:ABC-type nitrate/sulfonate/bicarbonate transport system ATPase subunit/ABC-type nitrate/sulfonate/bicarbonate transport system permease component
MVLHVGFYLDISATLLRGLTGFLIAGTFALLMAVLSVHRPFWKSFFHPVVVILRSIPVISVVLIALLWFSPPSLPVFIALLTMFPILYQNILSGLELTDIKLVEMAKLYHKNSINRFLMIYLPGARKIMLDGMATAMGFGWRAIIIGEALANPAHAIGTGMKKAQSFIQMDHLLAWTVVAIFISFVFDFIIRQFNKTERKSGLKIRKDTEPEVQMKNINQTQFEIKNIAKSFNKSTLIHINKLTLSRKNIYLFDSPSGSGKTTCFKIISGILKNDRSNLSVHATFSMAFQDYRLIPWLTVKENIAFPLQTYPKISITQQKNIDKLIQLLDSEHLQEAFPATLSGGEVKRIEVIRALTYPADILILDEPFAGLDKANKLKLIDAIEDYIEQYEAVVLIASHDLNFSFSYPVQSVSLITDNISQ